MNKYQEALDEFWEAYVALIGMNKKTIILKNGDYEHDFIKYKKSLQELVDIYPEYLELKAKATPMKPTKRFYNYELVNFGCPSCDEALGLEECLGVIPKFKAHCRHCGQALDWRKDE